MPVRAVCAVDFSSPPDRTHARTHTGNPHNQGTNKNTKRTRGQQINTNNNRTISLALALAHSRRLPQTRELTPANNHQCVMHSEGLLAGDESFRSDCLPHSVKCSLAHSNAPSLMDTKAPTRTHLLACSLVFVAPRLIFRSPIVRVRVKELLMVIVAQS